MDIKPIETIYNGYRFRSRLEARWAVFFDACGIPYQYEPEGFQLPSGQYLPDFYLPWYKCYVEIKPKNSTQIASAKNKLEELFNCPVENETLDDEWICMLCVGDPYENYMEVVCNDTTDSSGGGPNWFSARFLEGCDWGDYSRTKHFISLVLDGHRDREYWTANWKSANCDNSYGLVFYRYDFKHAKEKARQARFEHGECG